MGETLATITDGIGWEQVAASLADWIVVVDESGTILLCTDPGRFQPGQVPDELIGRNLCEQVHGLDGPVPGCPLAHARRTGQRSTGYTTDPGTARRWIVTVSPMLTGDGSPPRWMYTLHTRPVSFDAATVATLMAGESGLLTWIEHLFDGVGIYSAIRDAEGRITDFRIEFVTDAACQDHRMTGDEQPGRRLRELLPARPDSDLFDAYCGVVETGKPQTRTVEYSRDNDASEGLARVIDTHVARMGDGVIVVRRDVTDRERARAALREGERRFRELVEAQGGMLFRAKPNWRATFVSGSEKLTGYTDAELLADEPGWLDLVHPDDRGRLTIPHEVIPEGSKPQVRVYRIVDRSGRIRWVEARITPSAAEDGEITHVDGVIFDVTPRETTRLKLQTLASRLVTLEDRERRRLAIDLHDGVGQTLQVLKMELDRVRAITPGPGADEWRLIDECWTRAMGQTRELTDDLSPAGLHDLGLEAALRMLCKEVKGQHAFRLDLRWSKTGIVAADLPRDSRSLLYRYENWS